MYKHLFSPFKIGSVEVKNRIAMMPMGETLSSPALLETKIKDGAGLLNPLNYYL